jgi:FSR family fosmidomycin resistance protein-like MFS transporter
MAASFAADLVVIPLLERLPGRKLVRTTALLVIPLFIAFLLAPSAWAKIALLIGVRLSTMGWYPVLQGEAYAAVPGRSGTVMAITSTAGLLGGALVWLVGLAASQFGLAAALWLLLAGPIALALFVPRAKPVYNNSPG